MKAANAHAPHKSLFGEPRVVVEAALPDREDVYCPLCNRAPEPFAVDFQGFQLVRCTRCGLQFQSPRPIFGQLTRLVYGDGYHPVEEAATARARQTQFTRQLTHLERWLPSARRALLDVGCGSGAFLRFARDRGWQLAGTDVVFSQWAEITGARLWVGQLGEIDFGNLRFDVVRFNHVLEHTQDPLAELRRAHELLAPEGILLIGVPNLAGLSLRVKSWQSRLSLKSHRWRHYAALHHVWFFTPRTLRRLAGAAGFGLIHWETPMLPRGGAVGSLGAVYRALLQATRSGSNLDYYGKRL